MTNSLRRIASANVFHYSTFILQAAVVPKSHREMSKRSHRNPHKLAILLSAECWRTIIFYCNCKSEAAARLPRRLGKRVWMPSYTSINYGPGTKRHRTWYRMVSTHVLATLSPPRPDSYDLQRATASKVRSMPALLSPLTPRNPSIMIEMYGLDSRSV